MTKKNTKQKFKTLSVPLTFNNEVAAAGAATGTDWATEDATDPQVNIQQLRAKLPSAPKATRKDDDYARIPPNGPFRAHLSNIDFNANKEDLMKFFEPLDVKDIHLVFGGPDERHRGFGHVEFFNREDLIKAMEMQNTNLKTRRMKINLAENNGDKDQSRGSGGNYNRRGGFGDRDRDRDRDQGSAQGGQADSDTNWRGGTREHIQWKQDSQPSQQGGFGRPGSNRFSDNYGGRQQQQGYERDRPGDRENRTTGGGSRYGDDSSSHWGRDKKVVGGSDQQHQQAGGEDQAPRAGATRYSTGQSGWRSEESADVPQPPRERQRLSLMPRTKPVSSELAGPDNEPRQAPTVHATTGDHDNQHQTQEVGASAIRPHRNIFGLAKPVDTASKELAIEMKLAKEKEETTKSDICPDALDGCLDKESNAKNLKKLQHATNDFRQLQEDETREGSTQVSGVSARGGGSEYGSNFSSQQRGGDRHGGRPRLTSDDSTTSGSGVGAGTAWGHRDHHQQQQRSGDSTGGGGSDGGAGGSGAIRVSQPTSRLTSQSHSLSEDSGVSASATSGASRPPNRGPAATAGPNKGDQQASSASGAAASVQPNQVKLVPAPPPTVNVWDKRKQQQQQQQPAVTQVSTHSQPPAQSTSSSSGSNRVAPVPVSSQQEQHHHQQTRAEEPLAVVSSSSTVSAGPTTQQPQQPPASKSSVTGGVTATAIATARPTVRPPPVVVSANARPELHSGVKHQQPQHQQLAQSQPAPAQQSVSNAWSRPLKLAATVSAANTVVAQGAGNVQGSA